MRKIEVRDSHLISRVQILPREILQRKTAVNMLVLALALGAGLFLRLWKINAFGYNSDEAVYAGQAAAIAQDAILKDIFPIFRAHPLLFQFILALGFSFGVGDLLGRLISVALGLINIFLGYLLGKSLYGERAGRVASLILALMPYHVVVTRQVLLDGPMALFATLTLLFMVRFAQTERPMWLYAAGVGMGLTFLAKETGIVLLGAVYAFLALSPEIRVRVRDLALATGIMLLVISPFPLTLLLAGEGGSRTAQEYLVWQLFRRPNHVWSFYLTNVPQAIGLLVIVAASAGLWYLRRRWTWREKLLVAWIVVPTFFFQLWPVKGFQYLLPTAIPMAILAAGALANGWPTGKGVVLGRPFKAEWLPLAATVVVLASLFIVSWSRVQPVISDRFLAGSGGVPGGRETGMWIQKHVPEGARFMTIGPSMANVLQFYGHRIAQGLSVSPNPLHRNPSYEPIRNPDLQLRTGEIQYIVWDAFSAARSSFFSDKLLQYTTKYNGTVVHSETVTVITPEGERATKPIIIVYEVRP
jgi:hypothetical protein